jgi:uncharacterized membrane protein YagU involved in acid resistance
MAAGGHSYFNPLLGIPYYLMIVWLGEHTRLIAFIQGFYYGILAFILWHICLKFFKVERKRDLFFPGAAFLIGITNTILLHQIGATFNDIQPSVGILLSVYILMCYLFADVDSKKRLMFILFAGIIAGAVSGLKMTVLPFCAGMGIAIAFSYKQISSPKKTLLYFLLGCVLGFLLTNGFWMYRIYMQFQNPLFPFFNGFFQAVLSHWEGNALTNQGVFTLRKQSKIDNRQMLQASFCPGECCGRAGGAAFAGNNGQTSADCSVVYGQGL